MGKIAGIVLAAGRSSRMEGANKLLLPWGDKRIVQVVVEVVLAGEMDEVVVVTGHQRDEVEELVREYPVRTVLNVDYAEGLSTSVRAGVVAAAEAQGYMFALGDMPQVQGGTVRRVVAALRTGGEGAIVVPTVERRRGNPVGVGVAYRDELLALEGDRGARPVVQRHKDNVMEVPVEDEGIFADVDTREAYRRIGVSSS
ncbi:MAG: NTP transferase domain-containing protein [Candidatus Latescibacteria bacterium]|nr:NTP transferase domain-containing protein [Candidatus Latescibacterota bacterium]